MTSPARHHHRPTARTTGHAPTPAAASTTALEVDRLGELVAALGGTTHAAAGRVVRRHSADATDSLDLVALALHELGLRRRSLLADHA